MKHWRVRNPHSSLTIPASAVRFPTTWAASGVHSHHYVLHATVELFAAPSHNVYSRIDLNPNRPTCGGEHTSTCVGHKH